MHKFVLANILGLLLYCPAQGQLQFTPAYLDLGDIKTGQVFSHQIKVTNSSAEPISVQEIKASCGCVRPVLEPSTLSPGATGILKLEINSLSASEGPTTFGLKLRFPENGQIKEQPFVITARVIQELIVTPTSITSYGEKPRPQTITILDKRAKTFRPVKLERTSPYLDVSWIEPIAKQPQPQYALQVNVREDIPTGRHDHEVIIYTDDAEYPVLRIPISVVKKAKSRYVVSPYLVSLSRSVAASRSVTVRDQHGQGVDIERYEASPGLIVNMTAQAAASVTLQIKLDASQEVPADAKVSLFLRGQTEPLKILVNVDP
ncbi:MAG: DUF1573 domain-containing protein [Planctomycetia bacterium]|nr:DUF1573 domain-containing protein [Planctomycetia bacterium]